MISFSFRYYYENIKKIPYWLCAGNDMRFSLNRVLWETGFPWTKLKPKALSQIFHNIDELSEEVSVLFPFVRLRGTSIELDELISILIISRFLGAKNILEIGTFDGNTAINLAANISDEGKIVTLNLPSDELEGGGFNSSDKRASAVFDDRCFNHPEWRKVRQVYGDSAEIDWLSLGEQFDFVFIDGDHSSEYVRNDTLGALSILKPGGVIVWHDYDYTSVASVIDSALSEIENDIHWIKGTRLVVGIIKDPQAFTKRFQ